MLSILRTVAGRVKGAEAGGVLAELVAPEPRVILVLGNPVSVHVLKKVIASERLKERANVGAGIGCDDSTVLQAIGGVW